MSRADKEYVPCNLCGKDETTMVTEKTRYDMLCRFVKCKNCGLVYMNPRPKTEDTKSFYEGAYRELYSPGMTPGDFDRATILMAQTRMERVEGYAYHRGVAVDIGCATGNFLSLLKGRGWETLGIEPNKEHARYARRRGLHIYEGVYDEIELDDNAYNVVSLFHTLEHFGNPLGSLSKIEKALVRGGVCFIEVPNLGCLRLKIDRSYTARYYQSAHYYEFTPLSLKRMLEEAGLEVLELTTFTQGEGLLSGLVGQVAPGRFLKTILRPGYKLSIRVVSVLTGYLGMGNTISAVATPSANEESTQIK